MARWTRALTGAERGRIGAARVVVALVAFAALGTVGVLSASAVGIDRLSASAAQYAPPPKKTTTTVHTTTVITTTTTVTASKPRLRPVGKSHLTKSPKTPHTLKVSGRFSVSKPSKVSVAVNGERLLAGSKVGDTVSSSAGRSLRASVRAGNVSFSLVLSRADIKAGHAYRVVVTASASGKSSTLSIPFTG